MVSEGRNFSGKAKAGKSAPLGVVNKHFKKSTINVNG